MNMTCRSLRLALVLVKKKLSSTSSDFLLQPPTDLSSATRENPELTQVSSTAQGNKQPLQRFSMSDNEGHHAPKRRCMFKTSEKQLIRENNIRVAFHTPSNISPHSSATSLLKAKASATITRPELVTTSKYVAYHQQMGHTPQHYSCKLSAKETSH